MTVHFFTFSGENGGSSRQRAFRVADELNARGVSAVIHWPPVLLMSTTPWPKKAQLIAATIRSLRSIKQDDLVYLQRTISNKYFFAIMVAYLLVFRRKMIFDLDDPIWTHSFFKTKVFTQMADAVIVCNHAQKEWALAFNKNVHIFHISLNLSAYEKFTKDYSGTQSPQILGWVGTAPEHVRNLEILADVFKKLVAKTKIPFKFVLIGALANEAVYALFQNIPGLSVEFIDELDWKNPESVPREIQKFDIGVLPHRSEGEWNQAKTSLKILEYMACGVASVASAFGEMPHIVVDGVNGYTAASTEEWVEKLQKLLSDVELRARLGAAGQKTVREQYSYDALIPRLVTLLQSLT